LSPYRFSIRVAARQMSISGITFTTLQECGSGVQENSSPPLRGSHGSIGR
jgi:hypothetical protein